mgnify:CR=1 FL=1|jgi:hypothetical protein
MSEFEMVLDCLEYFKKNDNYKEILLEVPYLSRCIDMVIVDKSYRMISIEFKVKNWRRAISQAADHMKGADKAYICMPEPPRGFSEEMIYQLEKYGIGLLSYSTKQDELIAEVIVPKDSNSSWIEWKYSLQKMINKVSSKNIFSL